MVACGTRSVQTEIPWTTMRGLSTISSRQCKALRQRVTVLQNQLLLHCIEFRSKKAAAVLQGEIKWEMTQIFESLFAIPTNSIDNIALLDIRCF
jgi:hypothetical protein